ncbi:protein GL2-INTERACTING REPRESSOR 2-like [Actinidia eriantha]|uniref:protein GL2-INTERACTING REPRESSOR 2-like n=1 Tax=Actinidia eriantha TaxID=165200 RepID=UPI0025864077|nr:protein GL2-INTERACTING REPRESSOR 2-like [Actinidia eriantha]
MSHNLGSGSKLDLKLNLSPPRAYPQVESHNRSHTNSSMEVSPRSSCASSDESLGSPEPKSMMLVGCPLCLMYVMLSDENPKCPQCKTTVFLEIIQEGMAKKT